MRLKTTLAAVAALALTAVINTSCDTPEQCHSLRIMTYDVHNGLGYDKIHSYDRPADVINQHKPDVVALQEMDSVTARYSDYVLGELAERTGMYSYYGPAFDYAGGKYGVGILSTTPALSIQQHALDCPSEPRTILIAEFEEYYFGSTHLSMVAEERMEAIKKIREIAATLDKPFFFAGDLNAEPDSPEIQELKAFTTILTPTDTPTWNAETPTTCIDYIVCSGTDEVKVREASVIMELKAADHRPLLVDLEF